MKGEIVDITRMRTAKIQGEKEIEQLSKRLEELRKKKYIIDKEIQMAEFIIAAIQNEISPKAFVQELINYEIGKMSDDDD
jgi:serine phosphatase RsbU (regulator of sigma subunit)